MRLILPWILSIFAVLLAACTPVAPLEIEATDTAVASDGKVTESPVLAGTPTPAIVTDPPLSERLPVIQVLGQIDLSAVPDLDTDQHSVPLEEIIFDTFRTVDRTVPLTNAQPALIRSLRDAIPPLYQPQFTSAAETDAWLDESDVVLGYADGDEAYAYPVKILNFHEMVSQQVRGRDILVSYCPLCRSGIVYDRILPGTGVPLIMGNTSALFESDMVMFDHQTGSYWNQVSGEAIVGPLTGQHLSIVPAQMTTWGAWKALYPETLVLAEETGYERNYRRDPFVD
jgi:hypothetical protein